MALWNIYRFVGMQTGLWAWSILCDEFYEQCKHLSSVERRQADSGNM